MLVIRLQRVGKKKQATFRVVLQERSWRAGGKAMELLGFYNPHSKEKNFHTERVKYWLEKGAQPSPTVHNLLVDEKILTGEKAKAWKPKKKDKVEDNKESGAQKATEPVANTETTPEPTEPPVQEEQPAEAAVAEEVK